MRQNKPQDPLLRQLSGGPDNFLAVLGPPLDQRTNEVRYLSKLESIIVQMETGFCQNCKIQLFNLDPPYSVPMKSGKAQERSSKDYWLFHIFGPFDSHFTFLGLQPLLPRVPSTFRLSPLSSSLMIILHTYQKNI